MSLRRFRSLHRLRHARPIALALALVTQAACGSSGESTSTGAGSAGSSPAASSAGAGAASSPAGMGGGGAGSNSTGGTGGAGGATQSAMVQISIAPHAPQIGVGDTVSFTATVMNTADTAVTWSVQEGAAGGAVTPAGVYKAPASTGIYHVIATSVADPNASDKATVTVSQPGVVITPPKTLVVTTESTQFSAVVIGMPAAAVSWSIQEGAVGGTITEAGLYTAPAASGTYHVIATSSADASKTATAQVTAKSAGQWIDVTPPGISLDPNYTPTNNNYGAMQVVADSSNPGTFLVTFTYQGVWKSTDFGATWTRLSAGNEAMDNGRASMDIAPDGSYILSTLLYPINNFSNGCWKSVAPTNVGDPELGKAWTWIEVPNVPAGDDMGSYEIDPLDKTHVIGLPHTATNDFYESSDSGETWSAVPVSDAGSPARLHFIDSTTVLSMYDWGSGTNPRLGKKSGASWSWTEVFTKDEGGASVAGQTSFHSDQQILVDRTHQVNGENVIYTGGPEGIQRSVDNGASWTKLSTPISGGQGLIATPTTIYSMASFALNTGTFAPGFMTAPRNPGSPGSTWTAPATPAALTNGWLKAAMANTGAHYVLVGGMFNAGLWMYIEP